MRQVLCFGDSNTYGYIPESGKRYGWEQRWTGILQELLADTDVRIVEEGLVGRTTVFEDPLRQGRRGYDLLPTILESHAPLDEVVLMLGTNDCKTAYGASPEVIGRGIERLLDQIHQYAPDAKVLLMSPIELGEEVWKPQYDPEFNQNSVEVSRHLKAVYSRIAQERGLRFLAASDYAMPSDTDQEHMTIEGHQALAYAVHENLALTA